MAQIKNKEEMHTGERFMAFIRANERVFWVLLLAFLGFTFAFGVPVSQMVSQMGSPTVSIGRGEEITEESFTSGRRALVRTLDRVQFLFQNTISYGGRELNIGPKYRTIYPDSGAPGNSRPLNYHEFLLYRRAAEDEGLSVSNAEFEAVRKEAWQRAFALQVVSSREHLRSKNIQIPGATSSQQDQRIFQQRWQTELTRLQDGLKNNDVFDEARYQDWLAARGDHPAIPRPDAIPGFTRNIAQSTTAFTNGKTHYLAFEFEAAIAEFKRARANANRTGKAIITTWIRLAEGDSRRSVSRKAFEKTLRDLLLIARLDVHINTRVQVTGPEAFAEFKSQNHKRKFEWVKLTAPEELSNKVKESLTKEKLEEHYENFKSDYNSDTRLRFKFLEVTMDSFEKEVEAAIKEEDLAAAYEQKQGLYTRPGIRQDAGLFQLLSSEAMQAKQKQLYLPYEEVKEKVRERYIRETASKKVSEFADKLRARLYPIKPASAKADTPAPVAASFEDLAKEYEFIKVGETPYATEADAEEVFDKALAGVYAEKAPSRRVIESWYRVANEEGRKANGYGLTDLEKTRLKNPNFSYEEFIPVSFTYFSAVDIKAPGQLEYDEALEDVTSDLHRKELVKLLRKTCEGQVKTAGEAEKSAEAFTALGGSEAEIAYAEKQAFKATFGKLENSGADFIGRRDSITLPAEKAKEEGKEEGKEKEEDKTASDPEAEKKEPHPSSTALVSAGFTVEEVNGLKVVEDEAQSACYILRYTELEDPDSADFEKARSSLVSQLKREAEIEEFRLWRQALHLSVGDEDLDFVYGAADNCRGLKNEDQVDDDRDGVGAACDEDDTDPAKGRLSETTPVSAVEES
ncbi:MAG: hypothetical protein VX675_04230 [Planctomycetota bacterium]|nr:hypothetical protein [Planctomycetota bacterium]